MALRRTTGAYPGKLCLVGGTVAKGESLGEALKRHFREDFGVDITVPDVPTLISQYHKGEPDEQWMQDPAKEHNIAPVYLVPFFNGVLFNTSMGSVEWFTEELMPLDEEFGYTNERLYHKAFVVLRKRVL